MKNLNLIILISILALALFLRVFYLDKVPASLFGDEIDVGYQAYSILQTGRDLSGRFLPLYLKSLSEYRLSGYIYSAVPFIAIFGLNEWGVRLPAVFWGMISILGFYLLLRFNFGKKTAVLGTFLIAISPWHLQYSRASFEVTMLLSFIIFGVYFFQLGVTRKWFLILAALLFGVTVYIYSTAVVFMPLLVLLLIFIYGKKLLKDIKFSVFSAAVFGLVLLPLIFNIFFGEAAARFSSISIFQDSVLLDKINLAIKSQDYYSPDGVPVANDPKTERFFHNKPTVYAQVFAVNYLRAFSFNFLFAEGDINFRHSIHEMGELYYFELILLCLGIWWFFKKEDSLSKKFLFFGWLLFAPFPASLTSDGGYHATRLILMLPPLLTFVALGLKFLIEKLKLVHFKVLGVLVLILFVFNFTFYLHRYYIHYPVESWRWWHLGYKQGMVYMRDHESEYSKVAFNNTYEPSLIRFLVWWQYPPDKFQKAHVSPEIQKNILPNFNGVSIENRYYFGTPGGGDEIFKFIKKDILYMVSAKDEVPGDWDWSKSPPSGIRVLKTIFAPNGVPLFYVITGS